MFGDFFGKIGVYVVAIIVLLAIVDRLFIKPGKEIIEIEKKVEVIVTEYDTLHIDHFVEKIKYIKVPIEIVKDTSAIDSLYNNMRDSVKIGSIPIALDSMKFGKHSLWTQFQFPPVSKFSYQFYPGPDSLIISTITITKTREVDRTPKLSILFGPSVESYEGETAIGINVGMQLKKWGANCTYINKKYQYSAFWKFNLLR